LSSVVSASLVWQVPEIDHGGSQPMPVLLSDLTLLKTEMLWDLEVFKRAVLTGTWMPHPYIRIQLRPEPTPSASLLFKTRIAQFPRIDLAVTTGLRYRLVLARETLTPCREPGLELMRLLPLTAEGAESNFIEGTHNHVAQVSRYAFGVQDVPAARPLTSCVSSVSAVHRRFVATRDWRVFRLEWHLDDPRILGALHCGFPTWDHRFNAM